MKLEPMGAVHDLRDKVKVIIVVDQRLALLTVATKEGIAVAPLSTLISREQLNALPYCKNALLLAMGR